MRQKITKEPLSRESIKRELLERNRHSTHTLVVVCAVIFLMLLPMSFLFFLKGDPPFIIMMSVLLGLVPLILIPSLVSQSREKKRITSGGFEIHAAKLSYKSEELRVRYHGRGRRSYNYTECFHFPGFARVEDVPHTTYQLADAGETFFLVTSSGSRKVLLFYAAERYEFKELFDSTPDI